MDTSNSIKERLKAEIHPIISGTFARPIFIDADPDYKFEIITFRDCVFGRDIDFNSIDLKAGCRFLNCTFEREVTFTNCRTSDISRTSANNTFITSLLFSNCTIKDSLEIDECLLKKGAFLSGCNISHFGIHQTNITDGGIKIFHSTIDYMRFNGCILKKQMLISGSQLNSDVVMYGLSMKDLRIIKSTFGQDCRIDGSKFSDGIYLSYSLFKGILDVTKEVSVTTLSFLSSIFDDTVHIVPANQMKEYNISLKDSEFNNSLYVGTERPLKQVPKTANIRIDISSKLKGDLFFRNIQIGLLHLSGYNTTANLNFYGLQVKVLEIESLINTAGLILSGLSASREKWFINGISYTASEFTIKDSNLGKTQFFQCDLNSFDQVRIRNVILTEISSSLVKWFNKDQLIVSPISRARLPSKTDRVMDAEIKRDIFRQLKLAMEKQADRPQALIFHQWEMEYYRSYINYIDSRNWKDKIVLTASQTNDFGQNWIKALLYGFLCTYLVYLPIGFLYADKMIPECYCGMVRYERIIRSVVIDYFGIYCQLLNPAHVLSRIMDTSNIGGIVHFLDFLHRIVTSFFIFQVVSAFRKYVNR